MTLIPRLSFAFLLILLTANQVFAANAKAVLGTKAQNFVLPALNGGLLTLNDFKNKVRVVNFWASWCTPCRKEIPMFNRLQAEYGDDGVQFLGIAIDSLEAVKTFIQTTPINYPVAYGIDDTTKLVQRLGNAAGVLPFTVVIDRKGVIQIVAPGLLKEDYTRRAIEKFL